MNALQPWHLIILVLVVVVLFGAKRLPDAARSVGKSMKVFKAETKDMRGDRSEDEDSTEAGTTTADAKQISNPTVKADAEIADDTPAGTTAGGTTATGTTATDSKDDQVEQLQRQLDELKQQQAAEQAPKNG
ncbi:Sec-independent protein translocase subunit TatA [Prauserella halophila]|uniref:Sec-independent protein translocase protein TatA n=1 Tax=Prauserella halophila TaxID=185641 RepID=A0ABN1W3V3_9PSEU|nr:Sec-independent protein translocase subunit TatA [Prauserella halophila]MCP2237200.1 sec-independent protein translocase protein TatA [Prauserella halophila]